MVKKEGFMYSIPKKASVKTLALLAGLIASELNTFSFLPFGA
jgi:hypothetical protein